MKSKAKAGYMGSNLKYRRFKRSKLHFRLLSFGSRRHLFHLVNPSPWPLLVSASLFYVVSGIAFYMHSVEYGGYSLIFGLIVLIYCAFFWFNDIIDEATCSGYHTKVVKEGLRLGFIFFIVSELMLFFGFFWAFFHCSLFPSIEIGSIFPPVGIHVIKASGFPLFNTFLLILSGASVTWAHRCFSLGFFKGALDALFTTIFLGLFFVLLQMLEYYEASFNYSDSVYSCSFYMLTGLHGCHVLAGVSFLAICLIRLVRRHFLTNHYLGFVFAIWYWHFVDAVWILLFLIVYCWGGWGGVLN